MRIPNTAIKKSSKDGELLRVTQTIVNHRNVEEVTSTPIRVTVIPADKSKIIKEDIDYSLRYIDMYTLTEFKINDILLYQGKKYRTITEPDFGDFGFYYALMVEIKES